jgi:hypothetical protein
MAAKTSQSHPRTGLSPLVTHSGVGSSFPTCQASSDTVTTTMSEIDITNQRGSRLKLILTLLKAIDPHKLPIAKV